MDNADLLEGLRLSWWHAALEVTGTSALSGWLSQRLDDLRGVDRVDRAGLIAVINEVRTALTEAGRHDTESELNRTLLRAVYEYLLAVDAREQRSVAEAGGAPPALLWEPPSVPSAADATTSLTPAPVLRHVEREGEPAPTAESIPDWYALLPSDGAAAAAGDGGQVGLDGGTARRGLDDASPLPPVEAPEAPGGHAWASSPVDVRQLNDGAAAAFPSRRDPSAADPGPPPQRSRPADIPGRAIAAATLSTECDRMLAIGHHAEAAALLARVAGSDVVAGLTPVAIAAGDHCRDAGATRAASDCYLAGWAADRLDDAPLWRLAELAMAGHDLELAVSYLDRVAAILQWRGDVRGTARVYRKMTILAPDRDDLRALLRQAQSATESVP